MFGTLSDDHRQGAELLPDDDDDLVEYTKLKRMSDKKYENDIKQLVLERKIKEALNLFFEIQKAYEVKPTHVMFTLLIGGCGRVGYTKMAFKLYRMMRDRGLEPTPATLTGLFNSCAESPFPEMGLDKAHKLYEQIKLKNWVPSNLTYHAMIKAFGKCGDLDMAFRVMDEMADAKHAITTETFAFLLMACISNKEAGFSLGLKVMRTMLWKKIRPSVYCYNLFLRTVPQTEGDASEKVFETTREAEALPFDEPQRTATSTSLATLPNLLSPSFEHTGEIVGLGEVTDPFHRLLMVGGVKGMMDHFRDMSVRPDSKTITMLLDCIPNNFDAEAELIAEADKIGAKLDVDFFNMLIKRRAFRREKETAKDTLSMMTARGLHPDVEAGLTVNEETWGTLVCNACFKGNFWFLLDLMGYAKRENILVSAAALRAIDKAIDRTRRALLRKERGKEVNFLSSAMESGFRQFCLVYEDWLKEVRVDTPRHPWEQYEPENLKKSAAELKAAAVALTTEQT
ncbi:hypothetical protein HPB52_002274 [Rhipicephalus sanguineus]|uniref:Pentatricopeptide repeat-containing protein n=1 Tax=Rhipicephalus sanguineus TaxID=34632 RepID=A0A9D4PGS8_RHISA|nr:hypothetical protein HPB52_002274 [Rhipicephalus sanguineus]